MLKELDYSAYTAVLNGTAPAVIEFYSQTCPHCRRTEVGLKELAEELDGKVIFGKCNIAAHPALTAQLDIQSVPTLLFISGGEVKDKKIGFTHKLIIAETIKKL